MTSVRVAPFLLRSFRPPFSGLWLWVWAFFVWCHLVHPRTSLLRGVLPDTDDEIRLLRVLDWLKGQGWFDPLLYRISPPEGIPSHFSRLLDAPLAAMIWPLHALGVEWNTAALVASFIWPLFLFGVFFAVLKWLAVPFVSARWAGATAYVCLFATSLTFQFSPGRVDHHGFALLTTALALGSLVRLMENPERLKWPVAAGFSLAFGLAVSLETLPWVLFLSEWIGLWGVLKGRAAFPALVAFGAALYVFSVLFLAAVVPPQDFYRQNPLAYSYLYVLVSGGLALGLLFLGLALRIPSLTRRLAVAFAIGGCFFFLLLAAFPNFYLGPYGSVDSELVALLLSRIGEAIPLFIKDETLAFKLASVLFPATGLCAAYVFLASSRGEAAYKWLLLFLLLLSATVLAMVYQTRFLFYACLFATVPLAAALKEGLAFVRKKLKGRKLFAAEIGLVLLVGPLIGVLIPALADGRSFNTGVALFPVVLPRDDACFPAGLREALRSPVLYGDKPRLVLSGLSEGPSILFHTPHKVLAAPYHTNVKGNLEALRFFQAENEQEAEKIVRQTGAELLLLCDDFPALYGKREDQAGAFLDQSGTPDIKRGAAFVERLLSKDAPLWLKRVALPFFGKAVLYEVLPPQSSGVFKP